MNIITIIAGLTYIIFLIDSGSIINTSNTIKVENTNITFDNGILYNVSPNVSIGTTTQYVEGVTNTNQLSDLIIYNFRKEQEDKRDMMQQLVRLYKSFLKDEWTVILHNKGLLPLDQEVNTTNTTAAANIMYLMQLRAIDIEANKPIYSYYKNEFETFRNNIERLGGDMGKLE